MTVSTFTPPPPPPTQTCSRCGATAAGGARFSWRHLSRSFNSWCSTCIAANRREQPTPPPELPRADLALPPVRVVLRRSPEAQAMTMRELWLAFAAQCELHAAAAGNPQTTALLLDQARDWRALADNPVYIRNGRASEEGY